MQTPKIGFPEWDVLNFVEEQVFLPTRDLGIQLFVRPQNKIQFPCLDGEETVVLEIEVEHLTSTHALGFESPHRLIEQVSLSAAPYAGERHYFP